MYGTTIQDSTKIKVTAAPKSHTMIWREQRYSFILFFLLWKCFSSFHFSHHFPFTFTLLKTKRKSAWVSGLWATRIGIVPSNILILIRPHSQWHTWNANDTNNWRWFKQKTLKCIGKMVSSWMFEWQVPTPQLQSNWTIFYLWQIWDQTFLKGKKKKKIVAECSSRKYSVFLRQDYI